MARWLFGMALLLSFSPAFAQWSPPHLVMFAPRCAVIDEPSASRLGRFALDVGERRLVILGYADPSEGTDEADVSDLARRRASMVHEHLQAYGVSPAKMAVEVMASPTPAAEDARQNRRVEIVTLSPTQ